MSLMQYQSITSRAVRQQFHFKIGPLQCLGDVSQSLMFNESFWMGLLHNVGNQHTLSSMLWPSWSFPQDECAGTGPEEGLEKAEMQTKACVH